MVSDVEKPTPVRVSTEREVTLMNTMYDFVIRTTKDSDKATPAELGALPAMIKMLVDYWGIQC